MEMGAMRNPNPGEENGFGYIKPENSDGFVMIDVESLAPVLQKDLSSSSRFTRSLSRKGSRRSNDERKTQYDANGNDKEISIPQSPLKGSGMPEKPATVGGPVGPTDRAVASTAASPLLHQITITAAGSVSDQTERRSGVSKKTMGFKRFPTKWILDPKKVVLFFATLSSVGSMLLIIFTLSMSKSSSEDIFLVD